MDALVLVGGRGSRLAPWPAPKTLLPINGVPIVHRLLAHVASHVDRIIICVGYRASDVRAALAHQTVVPRDQILFSDAGENVSMAARLLQAREEHNVVSRALVLYGDELADVDIGALVRAHEKSSKSGVTFVGHRQALPFGVARRSWYDNWRVWQNEEVLVNIGYVLVEPACWSSMCVDDGLADFINRMGAECYIHEGKRATINSLSDLTTAEEVWR